MDIYDIAKKSGYSTATVSRVINNSKNVSEKARRIIEEIIKESGYKPNRVARSLAKKSTQLIGIMVPDIRGYFESQSAYELEKILTDKGYTTILCVTTDELSRKLAYLDVLIENQVEAIIGVGSTYEEDKFYKELSELSNDIPTALLNVVSRDRVDSIVNVYIDEADAMDKTVGLLHKSSCKKILYVSLDTGFTSRSYLAKKAGFIEALDKYYGSSDFHEFKIKDFDKDFDKLMSFLKENPTFDAIQFELDSLAVVAYKYLAKEGFKVPEDLALIGFDNIQATNYTNQAITSVDQRISDQVNIAVDNLMKLLENDDSANTNIVLKAKLVEKDTTI